MGTGLLFKTEAGEIARVRLQTEFQTGIDPLLQAALIDLADWVKETFGKPVVVTCLIRTENENAAIGGQPNSAHIPGKDGIRSVLYLPEQIVTIQRYLNHRWGGVLHVLYHTAGTGPHIHMNVNIGFARGTFEA
jgi:hypothetical protein